MRPGACVWSGECTRDAIVGRAAECVRANSGSSSGSSRVACWSERMCGAVRKCAESVRCVLRRKREYPSELVRYSIRYSPWIVYNHRARAHGLPAARCPLRSSFQPVNRRSPAIKRTIPSPLVWTTLASCCGSVRWV
jgi:hypothetical protein